MSKRKPQPTTRAKGRPAKGAAPALPGEEVDRLLVFGEVVTCDDGKSSTVVFPSYRDLAERYAVSTTLIAKYAKDHNCIRRRAQAKARIQAQADQKLVELRATAVALSKDDELRIIDSYLSGFERALSEGRVRFDNPGDFNTMVRLKEFVMGGADSRQELHASLSLEDIQARHQRMVRVVNEAGLPARGELPGPSGGVVLDVTPVEASRPPERAIASDPGDLNVQLHGPSSPSDEVEGRSRVPDPGDCVDPVGGSEPSGNPRVTLGRDGLWGHRAGRGAGAERVPSGAAATLRPDGGHGHGDGPYGSAQMNTPHGVQLGAAEGRVPDPGACVGHVAGSEPSGAPGVTGGRGGLWGHRPAHAAGAERVASDAAGLPRPDAGHGDGPYGPARRNTPTTARRRPDHAPDPEAPNGR